MGVREISCRHVVQDLVDMGFEHSQAEEAVKEVGPSLNDAANYILNGHHRNFQGASTTRGCCTGGRNSSRGTSSFNRQSSILDHFPLHRQPEVSLLNIADNSPHSRSNPSPSAMDWCVELGNDGCYELNISNDIVQVNPSQKLDLKADLERKINSLLQKHFGYNSLKSFQREALAAWLANSDCLVLAATGSGKSLCFQIPALLTGKVVVVISPLIGLMHDQCLKLAKHGVSACFLGSGQPDSSVEEKAMKGIYSIVYICPETVLRRLSVLREKFCTHCLEVLKSDIPVMALTATATKRVRDDIIKCLCMSKETKVVLTSFYRPNLRFLVKHSKTSSATSYKRDFSELIRAYRTRRNSIETQQSCSESSANTSEDGSNQMSLKFDCVADECGGGDGMNSAFTGSSSVSERKLSVEFLEDEADVFHRVDDWDVSCGEFFGESLDTCWDLKDSDELVVPLVKPDNRQRLHDVLLEPGPTIVYVPTRKETLRIAKFFTENGVKAAAYHAGLPKAHLRRVHKGFLEDHLEVVIATMAFGMGIDKSNVRRIIHYGLPQSLEAYYQEAGRAGRDGRLADCILYANLSIMPTLLPSRRSEEQKNWAHEMLSDCHRYGMNTSFCRAKKLVEYFGEDFNQKCLLCDVCTEGLPKPLNVMDEVDTFLQILAAANMQNSSPQNRQKRRCMERRCRGDNTGDAVLEPCSNIEKPNLRIIISKIREQSKKYITSDVLWWRGIARVLESKGYIKEGDDQKHVQIKYPEITELGMDFLQSHERQDFTIIPEADMLLSAKEPKPNSSFSEWGKGWADPEIRRERLKGRQKNKKPRKQSSKGVRPDSKTTRGRLAAKIKGKSQRS